MVWYARTTLYGHAKCCGGAQSKTRILVFRRPLKRYARHRHFIRLGIDRRPNQLPRFSRAIAHRGRRYFIAAHVAAATPGWVGRVTRKETRYTAPAQRACAIVRVQKDKDKLTSHKTTKGRGIALIAQSTPKVELSKVECQLSAPPLVCAREEMRRTFQPPT